MFAEITENDVSTGLEAAKFIFRDARIHLDWDWVPAR